MASIQIDVDAVSGLIVNSHAATNARGEGSIRNEEGSHTSPWILTVEGFRSVLQGKTVQQAVAAIDLVYDGGDRPTRRAGDQDRSVVDGAAGSAQRGARHSRPEPERSRAGPTLDLLQEYVSALMTYRNMLPLSAAKRGSPANAAAEAIAMEIIRNASGRPPADVRAAIFSLVDRKAIEDYRSKVEFEEDPDDMNGTEVSFDHPGAIQTAADEDQRVLDIVQQHLAWVKALFPYAIRSCGDHEAHVRDEVLFTGLNRISAIRRCTRPRPARARRTRPRGRAGGRAGGWEVRHPGRARRRHAGDGVQTRRVGAATRCVRLAGPQAHHVMGGIRTGAAGEGREPDACSRHPRCAGPVDDAKSLPGAEADRVAAMSDEATRA